jgi:GNAT superfamily N-acetyltransferase
MTWVIRPAAATDAADLSELAERTFREAFAPLNTPQNMDLHCAKVFSPALQAAEIGNPDVLTVVAELRGKLVAFAQLHLRPESPSCVTVTPSLELRRIYVDSAFHGTGLARELLASVLATAERAGAAAVWLGVWERNPRAIRFYQRSGFSTVGDHQFVLGTDAQRDLVMVRNLTSSDRSA